MSNFTITIDAPVLAQAINALAAALTHTPYIAPIAEKQEAAPAQIQTPAPAPVVVPTAPQQAAPVYQPPVPQPTPPPAPVPTSTQTYTQEQLAVAATALVDAGRRQDIVNLLSAFQVPALTALPKEQYGAFATALRGMGAKI